jgi:predicted small secreted protein
MVRNRTQLVLLALAVLPFVLTACGKGGGGY